MSIIVVEVDLANNLVGEVTEVIRQAESSLVVIEESTVHPLITDDALQVQIGFGFDIVGPQGPVGNDGAGIKYTAVTTSTRTITDAELIYGTNIFGFRFAGPVSVTIPFGIASTKLIYLKDETGNANNDNITVTVI